MSSRMLRLLAGSLALLALAAPLALAKQVRIAVTNFDFTPRYADLNVGDHAVWIWNNTVHTVTSGDTNSMAPDGRFNSGDVAVASITYSWKTNVTGMVQYYCIPHWPGMVGGLQVASSGAAGLSDFRITEVQYNVAGSLDLVEVTNMGATGDIGMYRLKVNGTNAVTLRNGPSTSLPVAAGAKLVLHLNSSGVNSATDLYLSGIPGLGDAAGSVAIYVPNTVNTALTDATQIIDYVAWGTTGGQENEATAASASLWSSGQVVGLVAAGQSMEFCGQAGQYGAARWYANPTPNFGGADNCLTPTVTTTWGRIKTLYK
ncbi:MAG: hypothetical protein IT348_03650 [Candidatus Eisenbacteria bacterium]|nr:hypothetical protein [Candidatus Eisenbacteria bacterium]